MSNNVGDSAIYVEDTSSFSPGDDIYVVEKTRPFNGPRSGGATGPSESEEFRTITDVDHGTNALHIHHPMFLPFPMANETIVGHIEWAATDVSVSGLNIRGRGGGSGNQAVEFRNVKHGWFGDLYIENAGDDSLALSGCYQCRTDSIDMISGGGYGITVRGGSTHTYCTNTVGDDIMNYVVRAGGSAVDVLADGVVGRNFKASPAPVCASHWGGFFVVYRNVTAEDQLARYRTREMIIDGFDTTDCSAPEVVFSQRPFDVLLRNGTIGGYPSDANEKIFYFRLRGDSQAGGGNRFGNEEARNIRIEDIRIEQLGNYGPEDIGIFDPNAIINDLYINATYGGQPVTRQHVEQWERFGQATINNLVVE